MPGSIHAYANKLFFLTYNGNGLGCLNLQTGQCQVVDLPLQMTSEGPVFEPGMVNLFGGIFNSTGKFIRDAKNGNGRSYSPPHFGGFGHLIPPVPVRYEDALYWQGALGLIYKIDLTGDFSPDKVTWISFDPGDERLHWCAGAVAVDESGIYTRSQKALFKLNHSAVPKTKQIHSRKVRQ